MFCIHRTPSPPSPPTPVLQTKTCIRQTSLPRTTCTFCALLLWFTGKAVVFWSLGLLLFWFPGKAVVFCSLFVVVLVSSQGSCVLFSWLLLFWLTSIGVVVVVVGAAVVSCSFAHHTQTSANLTLLSLSLSLTLPLQQSRLPSIPALQALVFG